MNKRIYKTSEQPSRSDIAHALQDGNHDLLKRIIIGIALHSDDLDFAEHFCENQCNHSNEEVRGNAILGFGHLARRFRSLTINAKSLIEKSLADESQYVRGHAWSAADDVEFYLGWDIKRT